MNANPPQNRGLTAIDGAMVLIVVLLIVQIWLLSATLESYLAGHREAVVPGVIISGKYSGDRADVRCAARWAAGRWALEVVRRLEAQSRYDVPIRTGTFMRVAAFDHAQIRHTRHVRPIRLEVK